MFMNMLNEKLWKTCDWTFIRKVAAVEGNSYEFSDDTFANDEHKPKAAMPIRSPIGDLGPLGDFLVKIGPLLH